MKRISLALLALLAAADLGRAAIDFTLTTTEFVLAGIKSTLLNFKENGRTITYAQPSGWIYSGGGPRIRFTPPNYAQAQAEIDQVPLPAPQNFDEPTTKALQAATLGAVPPDSQNVTLVSEQLDPLRLNQHSTYEVVVSYQAFGQEFMMNILYLNLPDTQVRFRTSARKADYEKVHTAFRGSIYSWQWK